MLKRKLSKNENDVLIFIREYVVMNGYTPTFSDIGIKFNFTRSYAFQLVDKLIAKRAIKKTKDKKTNRYNIKFLI